MVNSRARSAEARTAAAAAATLASAACSAVRSVQRRRRGEAPLVQRSGALVFQAGVGGLGAGGAFTRQIGLGLGLLDGGEDDGQGLAGRNAVAVVMHQAHHLPRIGRRHLDQIHRPRPPHHRQRQFHRLRLDHRHLNLGRTTPKGQRRHGKSYQDGHGKDDELFSIGPHEGSLTVAIRDETILRRSPWIGKPAGTARQAALRLRGKPRSRLSTPGPGLRRRTWPAVSRAHRCGRRRR